MKLDALEHPKVNDFAARLGVSRPTAIGHLELFWHFVSKYAPQGDVGKQPDGAIARASEWQGDPETFISALVDSRLIDESDEHRLLVHDWHEHCPNWVRGQLGKADKPFLTTKEGTKDGTKGGTKERVFSSHYARARSRGRDPKGGDAMPHQGRGGDEPPVDNSANGSSSPNSGPGDFSGTDDPPEEPSPQSGERRNGDFERINEGVLKLISAGVHVDADTRGLARALHCSVRQVEVAIEQLRDRGKLPKRAA